MQVQVQSNFTQNSGLEFGTAIDTPKLYYSDFKIKNHPTIKVGYLNHHTTINQLIQTYKQITPHQEHIKQTIYLKLLNGQYKNMLASNQKKLSSYNFNRNQNPGFQVLSQEMINLADETLQSNVKLKELESKNKQINVIIVINGNKSKLKIRSNDPIQKLKQKFRKQYPKQLQDISNSQLSIMINGIFINDSIKNTYLYQNCQITVVIKQKQGCFQKDSKVMKLIDQFTVNEISIEEVRIGDRVLSFNQESNKFQFDEVTYVSRYVLDQYVLIGLENGIEVKTTENHLFKCHDDVYRKCQRSLTQSPSKDTYLTQGTHLKLYNHPQSPIRSITKIHLPKPQPFYHLSINKNHNFIINNLIAHNMFVNIILPDNTIQKINITPSQRIINIKQKLQEIYSIQSHSQILFFGGQIIQDYQTLADKNIPKQSNIYLKYKPIDDFNFLHSRTRILLADGTQKQIQNIKQGQILRCANGKEDTVLAIQKRQLKNFMRANIGTFENQIIISKNCYFQLSNKTLKNIIDICYNPAYSLTPPTLLKYPNQQHQMKSISHHTCQTSKTFYKLLTSNESSYICNGCIINNLTICILLYKDNKKIKKICLPFNKNDKVYQLKAKITKIYDLHEDIELSFDGQILINQKSLSLDYNLNSSNILIANSQTLNIHTQTLNIHSSLKITNYAQPIKKQDKVFTLQVSFSEIISLEYVKYSDKTVQSIIDEVLPKFVSSSYFFVFGDVIILPYQTLNKLEYSNEFLSADSTILLIKNQKLAFIQSMKLKGTDIFDTSFSLIQNSILSQDQKSTQSKIKLKVSNSLSALFSKASIRIKNDSQIKIKGQRQEAFFMPFLFYTSKNYKSEMENYIKNVYRNDKKQENHDQFGIMVKELYSNLSQMKSFYGECYRGIKNFRFSKFYKVYDIFYWLKFTSASIKSQKVEIQMHHNKGTLFIINSLNGKNITPFSIYPQNPEILFAPFTYFMVEKIEIKETYEVVYLSQMSSPLTFQKNIILWVDDKPNNNANEIQQLLKTNNIQILQVTSTLAAINWVKQFGWLLNWNGFNFKLISNMSRFEHYNKQINSYAGVDLLEKLYDQYGITAQTLIYCGDEGKAKTKIAERKIKHNRFQVTAKIDKFKQFCKIKSK